MVAARSVAALERPDKAAKIDASTATGEASMDPIKRLECVYYPSPIPSTIAVLTVLCLVFDKVHFPNVYLPKGDYDKAALAEEISRLAALDPPGRETHNLVGMLRFLEYRAALDGILEFPAERDSVFGRGKDEETAKLAMAIYHSNFAPRENFEPYFDTASVKGLPNSNEAVAFAGQFYYQARAITYAADNGLPLLDDGSGLALPFRGRYKDNAPALSALLAVESAGLVLPDLPLMTAQELVDFRMDNHRELGAFRASMLRYAQALNQQISEDVSVELLNRKARFLAETEILPALHDLNRDLANPNRPWHKRCADGARIGSSVIAAFLTGGLVGRTAAEGIKSAVLSELDAKGDKSEAAKRNGLYYLLKARMIGR